MDITLSGGGVGTFLVGLVLLPFEPAAEANGMEAFEVFVTVGSIVGIPPASFCGIYLVLQKMYLSLLSWLQVVAAGAVTALVFVPQGLFVLAGALSAGVLAPIRIAAGAFGHGRRGLASCV